MPKVVSELVVVFIYRKIKHGFEFLLLKRDKSEVYPGIWSIAGGRINENEKAYETAIREMLEETGLTAKHFYLLDTTNVFYEIENDSINFVPLFLAEANDGEVKLSDEHSEYKWMKYEEAYDKIFWLQWKTNIKEINKILHNEKLFNTLQEITT
ncbi:MAG: NUDIX domain-containing protein [Bacteroidota bacterium]|nr:NUDIX domain-containing protein [Bacteroidota bacterium]